MRRLGSSPADVTKAMTDRHISAEDQQLVKDVYWRYEEATMARQVREEQAANPGCFRWLADVPVVHGSVVVGRGSLGLHGDMGYSNLHANVRGHPVPHAISMHPPSGKNAHARARFRIDAEFDVFACAVALNDTAKPALKPGTGAVFQVIGDGKLLWKSRTMDAAGDRDECRVSVFGVRVLELQTSVAGRDKSRAHALWVEPRLVGRGAARLQPGMLVVVTHDDTSLRAPVVPVGTLVRTTLYVPPPPALFPRTRTHTPVAHVCMWHPLPVAYLLPVPAPCPVCWHPHTFTLPCVPPRLPPQLR